MVLLKEAKEHPDVVLVEECRKGDDSAFEEIVRRYKDRIYNVVYRFLGNHEDAQDVAQEVFIRAYRGIDGFRGKAKVYTWLYSIAGNLARNRIRDGRRKGRDRATSYEALEAASPGAVDAGAQRALRPDEVARGKEMEEILERCLQELPEQFRMAFVLRTFENLSYEEIADAMDCPKGTVKSRLNQARSMLRDRLIELAVL